MTSEPNLYDQYAPGFLARRASRLMDKIVAQSSDLRHEFGIRIPVSAISTVLILNAGPLTVTEIASRLDVTHAAIIKLVKQLEAEGFVEPAKSDRDARRRPLQLTGKGRSEAESADQFMGVVCAAYRQVFSEIGIDLDAAIARMEQALVSQPFDARLKAAARRA